MDRQILLLHGIRVPCIRSSYFTEIFASYSVEDTKSQLQFPSSNRQILIFTIRKMSVATQQAAALIPTLNGVQEPPDEYTPEATEDNQVVTVTDLLLNKVRDTPETVFIQYPATAKGKSDYVEYTVSDIDRQADEAARQYAKRGLKPEVKRFSYNVPQPAKDVF